LAELARLDFLIGRWRGQAIDQFGVKGTVDATLECTLEPSDDFVQMIGESRQNGRLLNRSIEYVTYDPRIKKYICKRLWSMGFIENGVGTWTDSNTLMFQIKFDKRPQYFRGTLWRSFIRRYGQNEIGHGLYTARGGGRYSLYGETRERRVE